MAGTEAEGEGDKAVSRTDVLAAFCPRDVLHSFCEGSIESLQHAMVMPGHEAVIMWIDVCRFTSLAERLSAQALGETISEFFGQLVDIIASHGGDVLKFCGDALLVAFRDRRQELEEDKLEELDSAAQAAIRRKRDAAEMLSACLCAQEIQKVNFPINAGESPLWFHNENINSSNSAQDPVASILAKAAGVAATSEGSSAAVPQHLSVKISIAKGDIHAMLVGGGRDRWEYLVVGDPFQQIRVADDMCLPGEIVLSETAARSLKMNFKGAQLFEVKKSDSKPTSPAEQEKELKPASSKQRLASRGLKSRMGAKNNSSPAQRPRFASSFAVGGEAAEQQAPLVFPTAEDRLPTVLKRRTFVRRSPSPPATGAPSSPPPPLASGGSGNSSSSSSSSSSSAEAVKKTTSILRTMSSSSRGVLVRQTPTKLVRSAPSLKTPPIAPPKKGGEGLSGFLSAAMPAKMKMKKRTVRLERSKTDSLLPKWEPLHESVSHVRNPSELSATANAGDAFDCRCYRFLSLGPVPEDPKTRLAPSLSNSRVADDLQDRIDEDEHQHPLQGFVPEPVRDRLSLIHASLSPGQLLAQQFWGDSRFAEMNHVTVLFIKIHSITERSFGGTSDNVQEQGRKLADAIHESLVIIESKLFRYGGILRQMLCDDKGTVAIGVFGVPGTSAGAPAAGVLRSDDVAFALLCAVETQKELAAHEYAFEASIGVATGPAYCGIIGSALRAEFAVVGDTVNTAARIMSRAGGFDKASAVACDKTTKDMCQTSSVVRFRDKSDHINAKNKALPIEVFYCYLPEVEKQAVPSSSALVGSGLLKRVIADMVKQIRNPASHINQVVVFQGHRGSGKSATCKYLRAALDQADSRHYTMVCCAQERPKAVRELKFTALRSLFEQVLQTCAEPEGEEAATQWVPRVASLFRRRNIHALSYFDLLGDLFPEAKEALMEHRSAEGFSDVKFVSPLHRKAALFCVLIAVLQACHTFEPVTITVDDAHLLDDDSWSWLVLLATTCCIRTMSNFSPLPVKNVSGGRQASSGEEKGLFGRSSSTQGHLGVRVVETMDKSAAPKKGLGNNRVELESSFAELGLALSSLPSPVHPNMLDSCSPSSHAPGSFKSRTPTSLSPSTSFSSHGSQPSPLSRSMLNSRAARKKRSRRKSCTDANHDSSTSTFVLTPTAASPVSQRSISPVSQRSLLNMASPLTSRAATGSRRGENAFNFSNIPGCDIDSPSGPFPFPSRGSSVAVQARLPETVVKARDDRAWIVSDSGELNVNVFHTGSILGIFENGPNSLFSLAITGPAPEDKTFMRRIAKFKRHHGSGRLSLRLLRINDLDRQQSEELVKFCLANELPSSIPREHVQPPEEMLDFVFKTSQGKPMTICNIVTSAVRANVVSFASGRLVCDLALLKLASTMLAQEGDAGLEKESDAPLREQQPAVA